MSPAERYRMRAAEFRAQARVQTNSSIAADFKHLAECYLRLAEQAERNGATDVVYEPKPVRLDDSEGPG